MIREKRRLQEQYKDCKQHSLSKIPSLCGRVKWVTGYNVTPETQQAV